MNLPLITTPTFTDIIPSTKKKVEFRPFLVKEEKILLMAMEGGENDEIILSTDKGSIMRCAVKEIRSAGRNTQGVRIKKLSGSERVVSVIKIEDNIQ